MTANKFGHIDCSKMRHHFYSTFFSWALLHASGFAEAANILGIFTYNARSHVIYHQALMRSLADAGHNITFIGPVSSSESGTNFTYIDSRPIGTETRPSMPNFKDTSLTQLVESFVGIAEKNCYNFLTIKKVKELLDPPTVQYDIMFVQMLAMYECYLPIAKKFAIPVIGTLSMRSWYSVDAELGNPHPLVHPFLISSNPVRMSLVERLRNVYDHLNYEFVFQRTTSLKLNKFYRLHHPTYDLNRDKEISFLFVNWYPIMFPKAAVPTIAEIGGVHIKPAKSLPLNIQKFLDEAENGVILFTMGSADSNHIVDNHLKSVFRDAFAQIPQKVIWKFDDKIENLSDNVLLMNWLPQRDILAHENVKIFITHAGVHGAMEAIYEAKPTIMIPYFSDQLSNAEILAGLGVGIRLALQTLTKEKLTEAINTIINDESYYKKMQSISRMFKDRLTSPQETIVYWTEYVLRYNGTRHLRPVSADMPLYSYLLLDILLVLVICFVMTATVLYYSIRSICVRLVRYKTMKPTKVE